jgi:type VI protein secretion system component VasK
MPPDTDPLDRLRDQLDRTHDAARKLADEASAAARSRAGARPAGQEGGGVPPGGWAAPRAGEEETAEPSELAQLLASLEALRAAIPPELAERLVSVVREFLLALRALVDYALGRLETRRKAEATVEDIPIS